MKIILVKCMQIPDNLQYISGDISDIFLRFFSGHASKIQLDFYDATTGELPDKKVPADGFLFSGSAYSAYENEEWILGLKKLIGELYRQSRKMVGICFGHQIIADALGGSVTRSPQGWGLGVQNVYIEKKMHWMIPAVRECNVLASYQDQIETLPPGATVLGSNSHCRYFMYAIDNLVLGIQGHPEADKTLAAEFYRSKIGQIGEDMVNDAVRSLQETIQPEIWLNWIVNFFSTQDV